MADFFLLIKLKKALKSVKKHPLQLIKIQYHILIKVYLNSY